MNIIQQKYILSVLLYFQIVINNLKIKTLEIIKIYTVNGMEP